MTDPIEESILQYIQEQFPPVTGAGAISAESPLLESGLIDSLAIFRIIQFLEEAFSLEIAPEDVVGEHFESVRAIARLVRSRGASGPVQD